MAEHEIITLPFSDFLGFESEAELEAGVIDSRARRVFTNGQCHSLAIAMGQELGRDLVLLGMEGDAQHVGVVYGPDGYADIDGLHDWGECDLEEMAYCEATEQALWAMLREHCDPKYWCELHVEEARPFALAVIRVFAL